ncbi:MAG: class I SAM-dependent methyltransferase [Lachnospiraceae bacterium]|nr:class I SAM-dependent methyltransferase [Lachnospiraceae bacterium]
MSSYSGFAQVYDLFMDNIPYDKWCDYLESILKENGVNNGLVLELGCGTGSVCERLADKGYDMIGVDNSEEMLQIAQEKEMEHSRGILYLLQDMREFELYGTVEAVVSICDSLNYIVEEEDMLQVFTLVNNYLERGGLFVFDLNTVYKYENILADNTIAESREDCSFIWDNFYDPQTQVNEYDLTLFVQQEDGLYERFDEVHYQRGYHLDKIKELLKKAGLEFVVAYDAFTKEAVKPDSERIYVVAKEGRQEGKYYC